MRYDVILAGVGGQGVLSIAAIIGVAAVDGGLRLKQAEVHGMSQRGGAVESHLRIASRPIHSDLIPVGGADMVLSMEPMETLRHVSYLRSDGVIVADSTPVLNIPDYPELDDVIMTLEQYPNAHLVNATGIAKAMLAVRSSNMVLLGAASAFLPLAPQALEAAINTIFGPKGDKIVAQNVEAFRRGRAVVSD